MRFIRRLRAYLGVLGNRREKDIEPVSKLMRHPGLMLGVNVMELGQFVSGRVDVRLKALASVKTSAMIGCPF